MSNDEYFVGTVWVATSAAVAILLQDGRLFWGDVKGSFQEGTLVQCKVVTSKDGFRVQKLACVFRLNTEEESGEGAMSVLPGDLAKAP